MAKDDKQSFDQLSLDLGSGVHDLSSDTIKVALIDSTQTPAKTSADPRWGAGGTVNFSTDEVTPGGNYSAGGVSLASVTWTTSGGVATLDAADFTITQDPSNPTTARWAIIYNDTAAGKQALSFIDLGSVIDLTIGEFSVSWNASGLSTLTIN